MSVPTAAGLGPGWLVSPAPEGGLDLRVSQRRRGSIVAVTATLALAWTGRTAVAVAAGQPSPLGTSSPVAIGIAVLLSAFALWCAFASESWHVGPNRLEHRVGIGGWRRVRTYRDAALKIVGRHDQYGRPYDRLYAIDGDGRHFLLERRLPELAAWADLVAAETGWRRPDADASVKP
jgi:hypothetical protein